MTSISGTSHVTGVENTEYIERTGVAAYDSEAAKNDAFSTMLADALNDMRTNTSLNASLNMPGGLGLSGNTGMAGAIGGFMPMQTQSLEDAILSASESGSSKDAMMALMMLMVMMEAGGDGESSMMMQMMASMISGMQEKDTIRNDFLMQSGGAPYTLDTIDRYVFNRELPSVTGTEKATLPLQWWRPTTPMISSSVDYRDPDLYREVVAQFNVENAERYRPGREGHTYCNIYAWDVTRAMGAELPYYTDPTTGAPRAYPDTKGANYNGAIAMDKWLEQHGRKYGWIEVDAETAQYYANTGRPAVTSAGSKGHMQVVVPSNDGTFDPVRGVTISQAGRTNFNYTHISGTYSASALKEQVRYWIHP